MDENPIHLKWLLALALASILVGGTADLLMDQPERWLSFHVIFETLMIAGAALMAATLWLGWYRSARSVAELRAGLTAAIDQQFVDWGLTPAEHEVALLLLKGYSHKQVAQATGRSERTARQHAAAAYGKAGVAGRAELAAYFLEDLMLPGPARAGPLG